MQGFNLPNDLAQTLAARTEPDAPIELPGIQGLWTIVAITGGDGMLSTVWVKPEVG